MAFEDVAIAVLNFNGRKILEKYIPELLLHSGQAGIYVIDNGSTDDSIEYLKNFPQIRTVALRENHGFTGGYNLGLKQIKADYFVILNSDVRVSPGWLEPLYQKLQNKEYAVAQPKILDDKDPSMFEYAGACGGFMDSLGYPFCRGRIFEFCEKDTGQYDEECDILWASGACMMIRSDVFYNAGGFDAQLFAHMEEIDLCWRIWKMGYKVAVVPSSKVYHLGGATLNKSNPRKTYLNFRNNLSIILKNSKNPYPIILSRLILDGLTGMRFLVKGNWKDCLAIIKAHFAFYKRAGKILRVRSGQKINLDIIYPGSIVKRHFLEGINTFSGLKWK